MLRVFTAMGKQLPKDKAMIEDTQRVAQLLAKYNCTMVQGGAKMGLMGVVVQEFQKYSDEVVMIVPEVHKSDLVGTKNKEFYIVEGESDRMRITIHTCDMMIVLPGGSGTLAELAYYTETRKSGEHNARVVVINTNGYYNKLFKFHKHQIKKGFMKAEDIKFDVIKNADELEKIIKEVITEKQEKLQKEEAAKAKAEKEAAKELNKAEASQPAKTVKKEKTAKAAAKKPNVENKASKAKKVSPKKVKAEKQEIKVTMPASEEKVVVKKEPKKQENDKKPATKKVTQNAKKVEPAKVEKTEVKKVGTAKKVVKPAAKKTVATTKTTAKKSTSKKSAKK